MKIMLLGKNGQVGWELQRTLAPLGQVIAFGRRELDLADEQAIRRTVRDTGPGMIVNAAAYTAVDRAEEEPELAMNINGTVPGIFAEEAVRCSALLVHYSTDYVFDGSKKKPYREQDSPNPINVYGKTKLAGEESIRRTEAAHLILRTGWVYGLRGKNFLLTMLRLAAEREELNIVSDQYGAPTWSRMIAEATAQLLARRSYAENSAPGGLYHLTASGETTWYDFTRAILELDRGNWQRDPVLKPIKTEGYPTPAARPAYSILDNSLISETFALTMPDWREQLKLALDYTVRE